MTGVEHLSTARSGRRVRLHSQWPIAAVLTVVTAIAPAVSVLARPMPASAESVASAQAKAAQIESELQTDGARLDRAQEQYYEAEQRYSQISAQVESTSAEIARARSAVSHDQSVLRNDAVDAYTSDNASSGLASLFAGQLSETQVQSEYLDIASGNLQSDVDNLTHAEDQLNSLKTSLDAQQNRAVAALSEAAAARNAAAAAAANARAALASEKGRIAALVAQQRAAQEAAQRAAFAARMATYSVQAVNQLPPAGGAGRAVAAAESQVGVPYVWGGDTPGVGFDCSGLTMWAWGQAGVSLSHSAAAQYDEVTHVSLNDLQPGDLLFWAEGGYIGHVAMYIGNGDVVNAPETGETIRIQPVWTNGLVGAGRP